jgi:aminopeptidase
VAAEPDTIAAFDDPAVVRRFADLVVTLGMNLQPGQLVAIGSEPGKETLTRAIADSAYRHGASFVDATYFDLHVKRSRLLHAPEDTLGFVPPRHGERVLELGRRRAERVLLTGPAQPGLLEDVDPARAGRDRMPMLAATNAVMRDATTNWTVVPCPTRAWGSLVRPDAPADEAWRRLCDDLVHICRLDEPDPAAAWLARADQLVAMAARLSERRYDALRFVAPGTDLTVGLLPTSTFVAARMRTVDGIEHLANLPTEEVFTAPDPMRTEGVVHATKPLVLATVASAPCRPSSSTRCSTRTRPATSRSARPSPRAPARPTAIGSTPPRSTSTS